jgi:hypothetical protein
MGIVARAADRDVELFAIDQLRIVHRIGVDDDTVDGGGVGGRGIAVIDVPEKGRASSRLSSKRSLTCFRSSSVMVANSPLATLCFLS